VTDPAAAPGRPAAPDPAPDRPAAPDRRVPPERRAPLVVGLGLLGLLVAVLALTTPDVPLPSAPPVPADVALDFTEAEQERSAVLSAALEPWRWLALASGLVAAAVLGLTPAGARWIALVARPLGGGWAARAAVAGLAVSLLLRLARLPSAVAAERIRRDVGLSTRSWGEYALDWLRGLGVSAVALGLAFLVGYALVRRFPRRWWLPVSGAVAALVVAGSFIYPVLVEPVYNRFTPLPAGPLRTDLLALADARGLAVDQVLVSDASRRTSALNAYVSGIGASRRIVLYDTLLAGASYDEVLSVVAHEIGHAADDDVLVGTLQGALGSAAAVCLAFVVLGPAGAAGRGGADPSPLVRRAGATDIADPQSAALVVLLVTLGSLVTAPVTTAVSRRVEARADLTALELTRDPEAFVDLERRLAVVNLADLDPSTADLLLRSTHPSAPQRIAMARRWALANGLPVPEPLARRLDGGALGEEEVEAAG
jgi:STE24 endopeptidase